MRTLYLGVMLFGLVAPAAAAQVPRAAVTQHASSVVGTWELVAFESRDSASGAIAHPLGPHPRGILVYDGRRVAAQLLDPDRPRFASGDRARGTDAEIRAAFAGSFAYYGTYEVSAAEGRITHHVEGASFPNWMGTDLVREFRVERDAAGHDQLILTTPPMTVGGRRLATTLVWRRAP